MNASTRFFWAIAAFNICLVVNGCGERRVIPKGKVHKDGKVLPVKDLGSAAGGKVRVTFYRLDMDGIPDAKEAIYDPADGTFIVPGPDNNGIAIGKYKVAVSWYDNFPMGPDLLKGVFSMEKTEVIVGLTSIEEIDINVAKPPTGK